MAAGIQQHPDDVAAFCHRIEVSPSLNDSGGLDRAPSVTKTGPAANARKYTLSTSTSEFQMTDRGRTLPNFTREFARRARQGG